MPSAACELMASTFLILVYYKPRPEPGAFVLSRSYARLRDKPALRRPSLCHVPGRFREPKYDRPVDHMDNAWQATLRPLPVHRIFLQQSCESVFYSRQELPG